MFRGRCRALRRSRVPNPKPGLGCRRYHWDMVDNVLLAQVMKLDADTRLELRDAIEASVASDHLTPELTALLAERVAED